MNYSAIWPLMERKMPELLKSDRIFSELDNRMLSKHFFSQQKFRMSLKTTQAKMVNLKSN